MPGPREPAPARPLDVDEVARIADVRDYAALSAAVEEGLARLGRGLTT